MTNSAGNPGHPRGTGTASGNMNTMTGRSPYHPAASSRRRSSGVGMGTSAARSAAATGSINYSRMMADTPSNLSSTASSLLSMSGSAASYIASNSHKSPLNADNMTFASSASEATMKHRHFPHQSLQPDDGTNNQQTHSRQQRTIPDQLRAMTTSSLAYSYSFSSFNAVIYGELLYNATQSYADALLYAHALYNNSEYKRCAIFLERIVGLLPTPSSPLASVLAMQQHEEERITPNLVLQATMLASLSCLHLMEYEDAQSIMECTTAYFIETIAGIEDPHIKAMVLNEIPLVEEESEEGQVEQPEQPQLQKQRQQPRKKTIHPALMQISAIVQHHVVTGTAGGIHPMAQFCTLRGRLFDALGNSSKASIWLQAALHIDVFCMEAFHLLMERNFLSTQEQWVLIDTLPFDTVWIEDNSLVDNGEFVEGGKQWLRDLMISSLSCSCPGRRHATKRDGMDEDTAEAGLAAGVGASYLHNLTAFSINQTMMSQQPAPSNLFMDIVSPVASFKDISAIHPVLTPPVEKVNDVDRQNAGKFEFTNDIDDMHDIDQAFIRLTTKHSGQIQTTPHKNTEFTHESAEARGHDDKDDNFVGTTALVPFLRTPTVLASAAKRAYTCHALHLAASLCATIYALDPLCPYVTYTHMVTLVGLKRKRELFYLAHQLVQANPKAASSWFAVGCYYQVCGRYDVAQRHFCRATRLEPKCTESWIAFGNSFAMADESDQALAAYRAAQRCDSGNTHTPFLYMGMEYLRTSHLTLAHHFFECARNKNPDDPLPASELGVCAYKQGRYEDAIQWGLESMTKRAILERRMNVLAKAHSEGLLEVRPGTVSISEDPFESNCTFRPDDPFSCITSCRDQFWEPTISNLGHSYRKLRNYKEALICYETALRLCPSNSSNYISLGLTKQFLGDTDGAIDLYHKALSIKPEDNLAGEMLTRALRESIRRPGMIPEEDEEDMRDNFTLGQHTASRARSSFGSTALRGHVSGVTGRQTVPQQGSSDSINDSNLSFATAASDMDMNAA